MMEFEERNKEMIAGMSEDADFVASTREWMNRSIGHEYSYHFSWMGRPIIQYPQDMMAMQEIIWEVKPDLIVETGIARGGSLIYYASLLELLGGEGQILGIDIDILEHNRIEIEKHPMFKRITMIEGSSVDQDVVNRVHDFSKDKKRILVVLDSMHTHDHVLKEMEFYSPLVREGSYVVVFDTIVEDLPDEFYQDRPWSRGDNPKTAVWEFLKHNKRFSVDKKIEDKLQITVAPNGYLKCIQD